MDLNFLGGIGRGVYTAGMDIKKDQAQQAQWEAANTRADAAERRAQSDYDRKQDIMAKRKQHFDNFMDTSKQMHDTINAVADKNNPLPLADANDRLIPLYNARHADGFNLIRGNDGAIYHMPVGSMNLNDAYGKLTDEEAYKALSSPQAAFAHQDNLVQQLIADGDAEGAHLAQVAFGDQFRRMMAQRGDARGERKLNEVDIPEAQERVRLMGAQRENYLADAGMAPVRAGLMRAQTAAAGLPAAIYANAREVSKKYEPLFAAAQDKLDRATNPAEQRQATMELNALNLRYTNEAAGRAGGALQIRVPSDGKPFDPMTAVENLGKAGLDVSQRKGEPDEAHARRLGKFARDIYAAASGIAGTGELKIPYATANNTPGGGVASPGGKPTQAQSPNGVQRPSSWLPPITGRSDLPTSGNGVGVDMYGSMQPRRTYDPTQSSMYRSRGQFPSIYDDKAPY